VELFNGSNQAVNIGGWFLHYGAATLSGWQTRMTLPSGAVIPARGYYLVTSAPGSASYTGTAAGDAVHTSALAFSGTGGHVRLVLPGGAPSTPVGSPLEADRVGYGSADTAEGTAAPLPGWASNGSGSLERKATATSTAASMASGPDSLAGNNYDSQNNAADFVSRTTREPQNRISPPE